MEWKPGQSYSVDLRSRVWRQSTAAARLNRALWAADAGRLRCSRGRPSNRRHLDEMFVKISAM